MDNPVTIIKKLSELLEKDNSGTTAFAKYLAKDWDESKHPRGDGGKFGSGGGVPIIVGPDGTRSINLGVSKTLEDGARGYSTSMGIERPNVDYSRIMVDADTAKQIAKEYNSLPSDQQSAHNSYKALADEVGKQYDYITNQMGIKVSVVKEDPYKSVMELRKDVEDNHHIAVLATDVTGPHPFFTNEQNDQFRAVHDLFGHAATGRGFDRHGEEAAWVSHSMMFSDAARQAMTTETRGQNSVLTQGGQGFPEQKVANLPEKYTDATSIIEAFKKWLRIILKSIPASDERTCVAGRAKWDYMHKLGNWAKKAQELGNQEVHKSFTPPTPHESLRKLLVTDELDRTLLSQLLSKYNPDQSRDSLGRFGSGNGDGGSGKLSAGDKGKGIAQRSFAGEKLMTGKDSLADNLVADGKGGWKLNDATQARLDSRIAEATKGIPKSEDPTMHMLGGGPAAGKSSATNNPEYGIPNTDASNGPATAVLVNADEEKAANPTYQKMVSEGDPKAACYAHEESSYFAKQIMANAIANKQDFVLDGTGDSSAKSVIGKIEGAQNEGYKVVGTYVTCPTNEAVSRAQARAEETGRSVPEEVIRGTHSSVSRVVPDVASKFDSFRLIDTTTGSPVKGQVIAETTKGEPINVVNQNAYNDFLAKGNE
jgi:predicted ABC-type ATPase